MCAVQRGRFEPPNFSFPLVQTPALTALTAAELLPAKVIVVTAPTGYGKTVLQTALFRHVRSGSGRAIWVGLDERDQSTERVLSILEQALLEEQDALNPAAAVHQSDEAVEARIEALLDTIAELKGPTVLFIDNLSYCEDDTLRTLLDALALRTADTLYLVFAGGREPPMNVARLKLQGQLRTITFSDLSLHLAETRSLLGDDLCERLGDDGVNAVLRQSEGWPAAVRLMQIVLSASTDPIEALKTFSGSDVDLAEMLNRQVLADFPETIRRFLLETAHLRTFCVALCRQVTGDESAVDHVTYLLRHNVFVIPLDRNRSWYRLHGLFREFLVAEAQRTLTPQRLHEVQVRAAEWCEQAGYWSDAIDYALAAPAPDVAADILERVAPRFVRDRGDLHRFIAWVERLRAAGATVHRETEFWYVWALVFHRRYAFARQQLEPLAARIATEAANHADARSAEMLRRLEIIRVTVDIYVDRLEEAEILGRHWLASRGNDDPFDVATVASACGTSRTAAFDIAGAREFFAIAQQSIAQAQSDYGESWVGTLSAANSILEGDFALAYERLERTLERVRQDLGDSAGMTGTVAFVAARCAVEVGEDAKAREWLELGMRWAQNYGVVDTVVHGLDAALKLWASTLGYAVSITQMREIVDSYPPRAGFVFSCLLTQRLVRLGRVDDALLEFSKIAGPGPDDEPPLSRVPMARFALVQTRIELDIATGHLRQAEARIAEETKLARTDGRWGHLVDLALAEMAVSLCSQNHAAAARHLTRAITCAAKRRYIRPFRDRTELIAGLVNQTKPQSWGFALDEERAFFREVCRMLPIANSHLLEQLERLDVEAQLLETPTPRELELLSLIEAGLSNQQLADRLSVSVATVKWHLYNLYAKLGVSSRAAALAKGRALNLLSR
ncbi:hypothetical protein E4T66_00260 [Sinimarinibacterium sp. CAU 1509]|uniref:LuxR C-terminal-related transcriptional regulator n=1 Tax=Sinimarinibacterium sp. CAU 1509 TaxID=2562283 RepID=UPI0010ABB7B6|nr:LuxR C-terminal-related transcriptional regulator [Sinimarinibacterium sp. CAU 1509]TJY64719.1 hypothetical protein E4T66_00260 [Sinimarinibacterium sp. CAU 1509]